MSSGDVPCGRAENDGGPGARAMTTSGDTNVEFPFGAVFTSLLTIPLQAEPGEALVVSDLLPTVTGRFWVADSGAWLLKVYSNDGQRVGSLDRRATGLRRPVSLTSLHERWVAALDGYLPTVAVLDERGVVVRRFPLPELDRPVQILNLGDRRLAVVGSGWGPGAGHLVHLYTTDGEYVESLFGEPGGAQPVGRPYVAGTGDSIYIGHSHTDSFAVYDVQARAVVSFSNLSASTETRGPGRRGSPLELRGLFATACGPLIAQFAEGKGTPEYLYDLYDLDGSPRALGLRTRERVVGVEGRFFYSLRMNGEGRASVRVWRLRFAQRDQVEEPAGTGETG